MAAYTKAFGLSIGFFFLTIPYFFMFLFIPAAIGAILSMLITVYVPRTKKGLVIAVAAGTGLVIMIVITRLLTLRGG